jgi:two-component system, OmpR family, response regulator
MRSARILVTAADRRSGPMIANALAAAHHVTRVCPVSGLAQHVDTFRPDLVIMDLPHGDPWQIATAVRRTHAAYRPLLLCALDDVATQRTAALEAGADACIDKPFTVVELELHVRVLLRRTPWLARTVHQVGPLVVDEEAHAAIVGDRHVSMCGKQFEILSLLARNPGVVLSKGSILERLWGFDAYDENLVEVHICALRRHLPPEARRLIHTIRGVGYVLRDDIPQVAPA